MVVLLVIANLLNNVWFGGHDLVVSPVMAGALLVTAHLAGMSWSELGLARETWLRGLRWGGAGALIIIVGYTIGLLLPFARDAVAASPDSSDGLFRALVDVPLGTVLLEEVAFRGVLWGLVRRSHGTTTATVVSSLLFGCWHILPALSTTSAGVKLPDALQGSVADRVGWVVGTMAATTAAGVIFCEARRRSGSLLAPILLHWALNGVGFGFRAITR